MGLRSDNDSSVNCMAVKMSGLTYMETKKKNECENGRIEKR
jgi:hypothetical protein